MQPKTVRKSPVGSLIIGILSFTILYFLDGFTLGMKLFMAVVVTASCYVKPNTTSAILTIFMVFPIYTMLIGPLTTVQASAVVALLLLFVTLGVCYSEWFGALVGLWRALEPNTPSFS